MDDPCQPGGGTVWMIPIRSNGAGSDHGLGRHAVAAALARTCCLRVGSAIPCGESGRDVVGCGGSLLSRSCRPCSLASRSGQVVQLGNSLRPPQPQEWQDSVGAPDDANTTAAFSELGAVQLAISLQQTVQLGNSLLSDGAAWQLAPVRPCSLETRSGQPNKRHGSPPTSWVR